MNNIPDLISELKIERYLYKSKCLKQKKVIDRLSRKIQRLNNEKKRIEADRDFQIMFKEIAYDELIERDKRISKSINMIYENYGLLDKYQIEILEDILKGSDVK